MILLTGATGFLGRALIEKIDGEGLRTLGRNAIPNIDFVYADLASNKIPAGSFANVKTVIHCAARVHVMGEQLEGALDKFRAINTMGTIRLAEAAAKAGVKRFMFISTIKVNGEKQSKKGSYTAEDPPNPQDPYGQSKAEAENKLRELARNTGMEVVIIRPPLVYGPGVKANLLKLLSWVDKGVPLPLGAIHNKRSMVGVDNLVDLVVTCIDSPKAANQTFLVSDNDDVSTTELIQCLAKALGKPARLVPVPERCLKVIGSLMGKRAMINRLCDSLQVDIRHTVEALDWQPPYSMQDQLKKTVDTFKQRNSL